MVLPGRGMPSTNNGLRIPVVSLRGHGQRIDSISRIGNHGCDGHTPPMITPTLLRARSSYEPGAVTGAGILLVGISEGVGGQPALLSKWCRR